MTNIYVDEDTIDFTESVENSLYQVEEEEIEIKEDISLSIKRIYNEDSVFDRKGDIFTLDVDKLKKLEKDVYDKFEENPKSFINRCKAIQIIEYGDQYHKLRLRNFIGESEQISNFRVKHLNKIFKINGMISKTNKTIALVKSSTYECLNCGILLTIKGGGGKPSCSCGNSNERKFKFEEHDLEDVQEIELEENQDDLNDRQPQKIRVRLLGNLTDSDMTGNLQPGNKTEIIGVVEEVPIEKKKTGEDLFEYRLHCIDAINLDEKNDEESITKADIAKIEELSQRKDIFQIMAKSVVPEITGIQDLKEAVVLQQLGGVKKRMPDGKFTRDRIHVLCVGDAGLGKTQIAKNIILRTPRSYYTSCDTGTTAAGLTSTVEKDEMTGTWGLKAGAMCKANGSIFVADELDKAKDGALLALHTPLESGIIPVSKAGINTSLKAECSLLALANPKGGRFETNGNQTLVQQLNFPPTLLSRFDIVIPMRDTVDDKRDMDIVNSICTDYSVGSEIDKEIVPVELYRKYITYAKTFKPKLTEDFKTALGEFYNKIRNKSTGADSKLKGMPITPRHAQGIIRMSEAHAKLRLSTTVDKIDFEVSSTMFWESLVKIGMDEEGNIDMARAGDGETDELKQMKSELYNSIKNVQASTGHPAAFATVKAIMDFKNYPSNILNKLEESGMITKSPIGWEAL